MLIDVINRPGLLILRLIAQSPDSRSALVTKVTDG